LPIEVQGVLPFSAVALDLLTLIAEVSSHALGAQMFEQALHASGV
jgi:hypothetical protein